MQFIPSSQTLINLIYNYSLIKNPRYVLISVPLKSLLFFFLLLHICAVANAQVSLTGRVTDKSTGDPVAGATVFFPDLKTGDITDANGMYKVDKLPGSILVIQVSFLGYKSIIEKVDLSSTKSMNFMMEEAITEMNTVVITGTSRATELTRNPIPIVTFNNLELKQNLSTNIIDAVSRLPGVSAVTTGPNISKPFIHGLGYNRVLTLFDGIRIEGQQWGDEHGIEVDEHAVDHIEIVKGPASLTYGSDALAGVINLLPASAFHIDTVQGQVETNYQTNNGLISISSSLNGNRNGFIWGGVVSHKQAKDYQNKYDGRVYGTAFNETDLMIFAGLNKKWGYSHLNFSLYNDLQEVPDGSRDSVSRKFTKQITEDDIFRPIVSNAELNSYKISVLHQHVQHYMLYSSNNFILGESKLNVLLGYQQSVRREYSHPQSPETPGLYLKLNTVTYDLKYSAPESGGWEVTAGINGMFQHNANEGTEFIIPDYHQFDAGPFILVTKSVHRLDLSAGLRYDVRDFKNDPMYTRINPATGFDMKVSPQDTAGTAHPFYGNHHTFSGISGSIGATMSITERFLVKANIARGFRAPNILEISANGVHPGTLIYQIGNIRFKPEFSLQEDFGLSYRWDHISGDLDIFNNNISNYIFNHKLLTSQLKDSIIVKGNQTYEFQQANAMLYGWDASIDVHPWDWLHFENSISVIFAFNNGGDGILLTDNTKYLPFIPPLHTITELRATLKSRVKFLSSLYLKLGMEYYARQKRVYSEGNTETPTPGYILFNTGAGADVVNHNGKIVAIINILGNNLTDVAYQSHLSRLKYFEPYPENKTGRSGIYDMGRNISFKVTFPLDF